MPSLLLAVLALNQLSVWPLVSLPMIACVAGAAAFLVMFGRRERKAAFPLIELRLFRGGGFTAGILGVALGYALLYAMLFLSSYALLHGWHNSARVTGLKLALIPVAIGLLAPLGIALSHRWGMRAVGVIGMALCLAALPHLRGHRILVRVREPGARPDRDVRVRRRPRPVHGAQQQCRSRSPPRRPCIQATADAQW